MTRSGRYPNFADTEWSIRFEMSPPDVTSGWPAAGKASSIATIPSGTSMKNEFSIGKVVGRDVGSPLHFSNRVSDLVISIAELLPDEPWERLAPRLNCDEVNSRRLIERKECFSSTDHDQLRVRSTCSSPPLCPSCKAAGSRIRSESPASAVLTSRTSPRAFSQDSTVEAFLRS